MRQDFFEYCPMFKLVIAGNHKPSLRSVDEAIRRRFHLISFAVTIPEDQRDLGLTETLRGEWPGILQWMIDGCLEWQRGGLRPPTAVREATASYLESEDGIAAWIDERCELESTAWESSRALYESWTSWTTLTGEHPGTMRQFTQRLERRGLPRHKLNRARGFYGICVRNGAESLSFELR